MSEFNFRIINTPDGNQVIDRNLKTPYSALTALQMVEYVEVDVQLAIMDAMERKAQIEEERKRKIVYRLARKFACMCGIM